MLEDAFVVSVTKRIDEIEGNLEELWKESSSSEKRGRNAESKLAAELNRLTTFHDDVMAVEATKIKLACLVDELSQKLTDVAKINSIQSDIDRLKERTGAVVRTNRILLTISLLLLAIVIGQALSHR